MSNEIDSKETPESKGQAEADAEPEISEDLKTEVVSPSGPEVAGEDISETNEGDDTEVGEEDLVSSRTEDSEAGSGDSPENAATESNRQSVKNWRLWQHQKVIAGIALVRQHQKVIAGIALVLIIAPIAAYGLKHWLKAPGKFRQKGPTTQVYRASTVSDSYMVLDLAAFLVLIPEDEDLAYFSLSISVKPSNSDAYMEIKGKKAFFRGIIYGVLVKALNANSPRSIPKEELKRSIIAALNGLLITGTIDYVYFTEYLMV